MSSETGPTRKPERQPAVDWFTRPGPGRPGVLNLAYNALDRHVIRGLADAPALQAPAENATYRYAELLERVAQLAGGLRELGVRAGRPVVVRLPSTAELVLALLACARLGAVAVPLPRAGSATDTELLAAVRPVGRPALALVDGVGHRDVAYAEPPDRPDFTVVLRPEPGTLDRKGDVDFAALMRSGQFEPAVCAELPADAPWLLELGGAGPRVRRHDDCLDLIADAQAAGLGPGSAVVLERPPDHLAGAAALLGPLLVGATVELRSDPRRRGSMTGC